MVIDAHCDALLKLWEQSNRDFLVNDEIEANLSRLQAGNVHVQLFAIFVEPWVKQEQKFSVVLEQIAIFHEKVIGSNQYVRHITDWQDLTTLGSNEIGAILTLEGVDAI